MTKITHEALSALAAQGMTQSGAARVLGVDRVSVIRAAKRLGVQFQQPKAAPMSPAQAEAVRLHCSGMSRAQIAEKMSRSVKAVHELLRNARLKGLVEARPKPPAPPPAPPPVIVAMPTPRPVVRAPVMPEPAPQPEPPSHPFLTPERVAVLLRATTYRDRARLAELWGKTTREVEWLYQVARRDDVAAVLRRERA